MPANPLLHHLAVPRTARYYSLGDPATARHVWFALHGYGQLAATFIGYLNTVITGERLVIAPEALSRFYLDNSGRGAIGASWMTREDREEEIRDYVRYLDLVYHQVRATVAPDARCFVLGFSQGVATTARWVTLGTARFDGICLWAGSLPPELDPTPLIDRPVAVVAGHRDSYLPSDWVTRESERLRSHGIAAREFTFHGGHRLDRTVLSEVAAYLET